MDVAQWHRRSASVRRGLSVSILVLVDVAQWPRASIAHAAHRAWFQSLFSWMLLSGTRVTAQRVSRCRFQSLFSWMLLSGPPEPATVGGASRFQSLFSWMLLSGRQLTRHGGHGTHGVSILVLVDVAQWLTATAPIVGGQRRFQSLFSWMLLSGTCRTCAAWRRQ